jgi:hypothetical protein
LLQALERDRARGGIPLHDDGMPRLRGVAFAVEEAQGLKEGLRSVGMQMARDGPSPFIVHTLGEAEGTPALDAEARAAAETLRSFPPDHPDSTAFVDADQDDGLEGPLEPVSSKKRERTSLVSKGSPSVDDGKNLEKSGTVPPYGARH